MENKGIFKKFYGRLQFEGWLKALLCGLVVGLAADFIVAFALWFTEWNGLWFSLGALLLGTAVSAPLFYFFRFRPTAKAVARRVDSLGLEERLITRLELLKDESYIAMLQREDAEEKVKGVDPKSLRLRFPLAMIVTAAVALLLGAGMTTVSALSSEGILPGGGDVLGPDTEEELVYLEVNYVVDEGGSILGEEFQLVLPGQDATPVEAVADDGWMFVMWDDNYAEPVRQDGNIRESVTRVAMFQQVEENEGNQEQSDGDSDAAQDEPGDEDSPGDQNDPSPGGAGGKLEENNYIIDGETYYRDVYEDYYRRALEMLEAGEDIPDELRAIIEAYFDIIL